jgi:hypothetical protein
MGDVLPGLGRSQSSCLWHPCTENCCKPRSKVVEKLLNSKPKTVLLMAAASSEFWKRTLIYLLVMVDMASGIGFLIAAKSIFRFGEIKDRTNRMEAEYILIGTLASFAYAMVIAYGSRWLIFAVARWEL